MKTLPVPPTKSFSNSRKDSSRVSMKAPLFLGHKVLGELRILMRLASGQNNGWPRLNGYDPSSSF